MAKSNIIPMSDYLQQEKEKEIESDYNSQFVPKVKQITPLKTFLRPKR